MDNLFFVVGDKFACFSSNHHVISFSEMEEVILRSKNKKNDIYIIGQGINSNKFECFMEADKTMIETNISIIMNHNIFSKK